MPNIIYTKKARKIVEEDTPLPDEEEAIWEAKQEIERGELYSHEEVWG